MSSNFDREIQFRTVILAAGLGLGVAEKAGITKPIYQAAVVVIFALFGLAYDLGLFDVKSRAEDDPF